MIIKKILSLTVFFLLCSCVNNKVISPNEKKYYTSSGFALIYADHFYDSKLIKRKLDNDKILVLHNTLKANTPIKIVNPINSNEIITKVYRKSIFPGIFNVVITEKIAKYLEIDSKNPYVEIFEVKINKKFIAKKSTIFKEEVNVAAKVPVDEITVNNLSKNIKKKALNIDNKKSYFLLVSDFYYLDSANNLKKELTKQTNNNSFKVKKINTTKYRLTVGPFKDFSSLKNVYISLNDLGFTDLNIYKE
jgi:hypothetical protein